MKYAINHCDLCQEVEDGGMSKPDIQEALMERVGQIIAETYRGGKKSKPHKYLGIELMAKAVAQEVIQEGANKVAKDLNIDLTEMTDLAKSSHISFC